MGDEACPDNSPIQFLFRIQLLILSGSGMDTVYHKRIRFNLDQLNLKYASPIQKDKLISLAYTWLA